MAPTRSTARRATWQFKLTPTQLDGLEQIHHGGVPPINTLSALMRRELVDEDVCLTDTGCAYLNHARPWVGATVPTRKGAQA